MLVHYKNFIIPAGHSLYSLRCPYQPILLANQPTMSTTFGTKFLAMGYGLVELTSINTSAYYSLYIFVPIEASGTQLLKYESNTKK